MTTFEGNLIGKELKIAIVVSRFNEFITGKLLAGAEDALKRHGVAKDDIDIIWVPGAFEIPAIAKIVMDSQKYDGIITLGAVIRGATTHYDYVCNEVAKGIGQLSLQGTTPVVFGVVTTESIEQAIERAGTKSGNKGFDVAVNVIELANLTKQLHLS